MPSRQSSAPILLSLLAAGASGCGLVLGLGDYTDVDGSTSTSGSGTCSDDEKNNGETDTDCGGPCSPCDVGKGCMNGADCTSHVCPSGTCLAPTCDDQVQNGDETGIDCGGPACATRCPDGQGCGANSDCASGVCDATKCASYLGWQKGFGAVGYMPPIVPFASIGVDGAGNVFALNSFQGFIDYGGGQSGDASTYTTSIGKFDSTGKYLWSQSFAATSAIIGVHAAVDDAGSVAFGGVLYGTIDFGGGSVGTAQSSVFLAKLDPSGNHEWSKAFAGVVSSLNGFALSGNGSGGIVVAGYLDSNIDFGGGPLATTGNDCFVASFDASGKHVWSKSFAGTDTWRITSVAMDGTGNTVLGGTFKGSLDFGATALDAAGSEDIFVAELDTKGDEIWSRSFGSANEGQVLRDLAVDGAGAVILIGEANGILDFGAGSQIFAGDIFAAKLDASGKGAWSKAFGKPPPQYAQTSVAVDAAGQYVFSGNFHDHVDFGGGVLTAPGVDADFVAKLDAAGEHVWSRTFVPGPQSSPPLITDVATGGGKDPVLTGLFNGMVDFGIAPLTAQGNTTSYFLLKLHTP